MLEEKASTHAICAGHLASFIDNNEVSRRKARA